MDDNNKSEIIITFALKLIVEKRKKQRYFRYCHGSDSFRVLEALKRAHLTSRNSKLNRIAEKERE